MDERCQIAHAKLLAGTCPWCQRPIINGRPSDEDWISAALGIAPPFLGTTLGELVGAIGRLEVGRAAKYIEDVAKQLADIHNSARTHGRVCPGTIFVDADGKAHLATNDLIHEDVPDELLQSAVLQSTVDAVDCMPPEQALNGYAVDTRSDIYSLGCTFYFLLSGRLPFPNGSIAERLLKHQTAAPDKIRSLRIDLPDSLVVICEKMMAKKPIERFQTAASVAHAIEEWRLGK